jgi:putative transposase
MEVVFSEKGVPRGRGKVERFFRSVDQLFLQDVTGYSTCNEAYSNRSCPNP